MVQWFQELLNLNLINMAKYNIYAHDNENPESDIVYICNCDNKNIAQYIVKALKHKDSDGGKYKGLYDFYIKEI